MGWFLGSIGTLVVWCICLTVSNRKLKRRMSELEKFVDVALGNVEDKPERSSQAKQYGVRTVEM